MLIDKQEVKFREGGNIYRKTSVPIGKDGKNVKVKQLKIPLWITCNKSTLKKLHKIGFPNAEVLHAFIDGEDFKGLVIETKNDLPAMNLLAHYGESDSIILDLPWVQPVGRAKLFLFKEKAVLKVKVRMKLTASQLDDLEDHMSNAHQETTGIKVSLDFSDKEQLKMFEDIAPPPKVKKLDPDSVDATPPADIEPGNPPADAPDHDDAPTKLLMTTDAIDALLTAEMAKPESKRMTQLAMTAATGMGGTALRRRMRALELKGSPPDKASTN